MYGTATNTGKGFFTHQDRQDFYLAGHPGNVWVIGKNEKGALWLAEKNGTVKTHAEAQAIVDAEVTAAQAVYDAMSDEQKSEPHNIRPGPITLPYAQEFIVTVYNTLKGLKIRYVSTDPSGAENGQVWYNSTSGNSRVAGILAPAAWSSAPAPAVNKSSFSSGGTQTAAILSGAAGANPANSAKAEEYNGSSWTALTNMPAAYGYNVGCGTVSDFASMGGGYPSYVSTVFDWNGSGWTTGASLPAATIEAGACGPGQQALFVGGYGGGGNLATTHERSGGSWTTTNNLNTGRYIAATTGTKADAIASGGVVYPSSPAYKDFVETYNGSSWTAETALPSTRGYSGSAGSSSNDQFIFGGTPGTGSLSNSFKYNGSSWTADASLATARNGLGGFGSSTAALCAANYPSPSASEEYNGASIGNESISTS